MPSNWRSHASNRANSALRPAAMRPDMTADTTGGRTRTAARRFGLALPIAAALLALHPTPLPADPGLSELPALGELITGSASGSGIMPGAPETTGGPAPSTDPETLGSAEPLGSAGLAAGGDSESPGGMVDRGGGGGGAVGVRVRECGHRVCGQCRARERRAHGRGRVERVRVAGARTDARGGDLPPNPASGCTVVATSSTTTRPPSAASRTARIRGSATAIGSAAGTRPTTENH